VYCGTELFHWSSFEGLMTELDMIDDSRLHQHPSAIPIKASDACRLHCERNLWHDLPISGKGLELYELLNAHQNAECTDIRDRLFGLLGLTASTGTASPIAVNYLLSVRELYTQTLKHINHKFSTAHGKQLDRAELKKHATFLQRLFKLDYVDNLVEEEVNKIMPPVQTRSRVSQVDRAWESASNMRGLGQTARTLRELLESRPNRSTIHDPAVTSSENNFNTLRIVADPDVSIISDQDEFLSNRLPVQIGSSEQAGKSEESRTEDIISKPKSSVSTTTSEDRRHEGPSTIP
jgi:hypothetical protein